MLEGNLRYGIGAAVGRVRSHEAGPAAGWPEHLLRFVEGRVDVGVLSAQRESEASGE